MGQGGFRGLGCMARGACALAALPITAALAPISAEAQSVDTAFGRAEIAEDISIADIDDLRSGPCQAAVFEGQASSGATLRIIRPGGNSITLTNPGGATMQVRNFTFLGGAGLQDQGQNGANHRFGVTSATGDFTVYAGATLQVGANQAPGIYTGTFTIHLQYN